MAGSYEKAVQLLATRPHFRRELDAKLRQRGFPAEDIEETLARLTAQGYLDDPAAARSFVQGRAAKGEGKARLRAELARRGASGEAIEEALASFTDEDDLEGARQSAESWRRRGGTDPRALARHLARKGFSHRAIVAALTDSSSGDLDLEFEGEP